MGKRIIEELATDTIQDNDFILMDNNTTPTDPDDDTAGTRKIRASEFGAQIITVDDELSTSSENPVQNKVITGAINDLASATEITGTASGSIASFDDGSEMPLKTLQVSIEPVQSGSGDPSPSNIRPISGWDGANVNVSGANLWDEEWELGNISTTNGSNIDASNKIRSKNSIKVKPSTSYANVGYALTVYEYDKDNAFISSSTKQVGSFTVGDNTYYIRFSRTATTYNNDISINYPSTDTSYHAYNGNTYPISWQTECGTVYGGNFKVFKDGGKWYITVNSCPYFASYNGETLVGEWISDRDVYAVGTTPTIGAQVVNIGGEVTTTTFEISTEIATLLGVNNIFADCGDVEECRYVRDATTIIDYILSQLNG